MESTKLVTDNEIRADFAQKLTRRFEAMALGQCTCPEYWRDCDGTGTHARSCAAYSYAAARRIVALTLADENGEEE